MATNIGGQYRAICEAERYRTAAQIAKQPEELKKDCFSLFVAIQSAVNDYVNREDKYIHETVTPFVLRLAADEIERITQRLKNLPEKGSSNV